ncbi:MAG: polysaccharide deacetylase family protein [Bacilli bacterium]|nr:polysaccharide deacetylase family protein [Bacilli bacterium]
MASKGSKKINKIRRKRPYQRIIKTWKFNDFKDDIVEDNTLINDDVKSLDSEVDDEFIIPSFSVKYKCVYSDSSLIDNNSIDCGNDAVPKKKRRRLKSGVVFSLVLCFFIIISVFLCYLFVPYIKLNGKNKVIINYKQKYKDSGYSAKIGGKNISEMVKVSGSVNVDKLGEYKITYQLKKGIFNIKRTRRVIVKDIKGPAINLKGGKNYYVCPGKKFKDPGYIVSDNYDKKLSDVEIRKKKDVYTYVVKDGSGNKTVVKRNIIYEDNKSPVISFGSSNNLYVSLGDKVVFDDVKAQDNCDGDLTGKIKIEGSVDVDKAGEYEIVYRVKDSAGNEAMEKRKVFVTKKDAPGTIYLTFDDGPKEGTTNVILDILKEENVKATFFVTNSGPDSLIVRAHNEGHTIALHTSSHDYSYLYSSGENYFKDLYSVQDRVNRLIGVKPTIIRFPGGSSNTVSRKYSPGIMTYLTQEVLNRGFKYYDWNLSSGDAGEVNDSDGVYNTVVNKLSHDRVNMILMHDIKSYTRDALQRIIRYAKENGYTFDVIDNNTEMVRQRVNN